MATFAHMEASSCRILAAAAEAACEPRAAEVCRGLLDKELEFVPWLDEQLAFVTPEYLSREGSGQSAESALPG